MGRRRMVGRRRRMGRRRMVAFELNIFTIQNLLLDVNQK
jgi:hypothetical protein